MAYVDGGVEIRYFLHLETTGNEIEYVALYIETDSEIEGLAGGYDEFERMELAMEQLQEMNRRNLGNFTFSLQSYSRDSLVMILAVDESGCEKARVVLRPHGSSESIGTEG